jgi:formate dehydrogenase subunit gamma
MNTRSGLASLAIVLCALVAPAAAFAQSTAPAVAPASAPAAQPSEQDTQARRQAVQPGNNAPVWREVKSGGENYTSIKGPETGVLIQQQAKFFGQDTMSTAGEAWRKYRNGPVTFYGGWFVVLAALAIGGFYLWKGPIKLHEPPSGRPMLRFTMLERWAHWSVAISFCVLGISGLVMLFGKHILLPVIGYTLFAWLTMLMKNLHNFIGPLFILSIVLLAVIFVRWNLPGRGDLTWLMRFGGMLSGKEVPSGRFNAGEKGWFWVGLIGLGTLMGVTGLIMLFPNFEQVRSTMQQANILHAVGAIAFIAMSFGHIYIGTIGMERAFDGMRTGYSDEEWIKEHHELYYNDVKAGRVKIGGEPASAARPQNLGGSTP